MYAAFVHKRCSTFRSVQVVCNFLAVYNLDEKKLELLELSLLDLHTIMIAVIAIKGISEMLMSLSHGRLLKYPISMEFCEFQHMYATVYTRHFSQCFMSHLESEYWWMRLWTHDQVRVHLPTSHHTPLAYPTKMGEQPWLVMNSHQLCSVPPEVNRTFADYICNGGGPLTMALQVPCPTSEATLVHSLSSVE